MSKKTLSSVDNQKYVVGISRFDTGFFRWGGGGGGKLASDSISGQDIGICIVCFGPLGVFEF